MDTTSATPGVGTPPLTGQKLLAVALAQQLVDADDLPQVLGDVRTNPTVPGVQRRLLAAGVEDRAVADASALACGRPVLADGAVPVAVLPEQLAAAAGAVAIQATDDGRPVVAMVEDGADNLSALQTALGDSPFTIHMVTVDRFERLLAAAYDADAAAGANLRDATDVFELFDEVLRRRGTDLHVKVGQPVGIRVDGDVAHLPVAPVQRDWLHAQIARITPPDLQRQLASTFDVDYAYTYGSRRFRMNIGMDAAGPVLAARLLSESIPSMNDLRLPRSVRNFADLERGLVLVTGPTGSGKSTTLAALLQHVAANQSRHIITLENPVEYQLVPGRGMVSQRELGTSFTSFSAGLRQALRQDPDVILVGEMRDAETIATAVTAAETGHLVFATLHTVDAAQTLNRVISSFPPAQQHHIRAQLAYILEGVVAQTLLPRAGRSGLVAAFEILRGTTAVRTNLRRPDGMEMIANELETGAQAGMQTMDTALARLVVEGQVDLQVAMARSRQPDVLQAKVAHLSARVTAGR